MNRDDQIRHHDFGSLRLSFRGLVVPLLSERTKAKIAAMSLADAKTANAAAWKARRAANRIANRHCNWSVPGNIAIYEPNAQASMIAELVCKATYKRMMQAEEFA